MGVNYKVLMELSTPGIKISCYSTFRHEYRCLLAFMNWFKRFDGSTFVHNSTAAAMFRATLSSIFIIKYYLINVET